MYKSTESLTVNFSFGINALIITWKEWGTNLEKKKLSKTLLVAFILGVLYLLYSASYWSGAVSSSTDTAEQIGAGLAAAIVMPHLICTFIGVLFNGLGLFLRKRGFALTGAILYTVAMVLFPVYFFFVVVQAILSYIGFAKMKKEN